MFCYMKSLIANTTLNKPLGNQYDVIPFKLFYSSLLWIKLPFSPADLYQK
jgi:hypothetical protein